MVSIILVEDHHLVRQGIRSLMEKQSGCTIVAESGNGLEAVQLVEQHQPDILILDLMLPGLNGLDVTRQVTKRFPKINVIILSMHADESYIVKAFGNGARGYILKESTVAELMQAIQAVQNNGRYLSHPLSERALDYYLERSPEAEDDPLGVLTKREREIFQLVAEGQNSPGIGRLLVLSPRTIEVHRANIMRKLTLRSQVDLIRFALKHGLISSE